MAEGFAYLDDASPCAKPNYHNGWNWNGPAEGKTHRYRQVCRHDDDRVTWLYQSDDNFLFSSAAFMGANNNDLESITYWSEIAVKGGIIFA